LEVGGAFGHRFKSLIEFLGLVALVITDLDSVTLVPNAAEDGEDEATEFEVPNAEKDLPPVGTRSSAMATIVAILSGGTPAALAAATIACRCVFSNIFETTS
jgi:hypothetical protein